MVQPVAAKANDKPAVAPQSSAPQVDPGRLAELRGKIPAKWLGMLTAAEADPSSTGLEKFKIAVYKNLYDPKNGGIDALTAYLGADPDKKPLADGAQAMISAYSIDRPHVDLIVGGVLRFLGGGPVSDATSVVAAGYPKITSYGRIFLKEDQQYVDWLETYSNGGAERDGNNEQPPAGEARKNSSSALLKILKGEAKGIFETAPDRKPAGAPGAVDLLPGDPKKPLNEAQEKQLADMRKRILDLCPERKPGTQAPAIANDVLEKLIADLKACDSIVQDRLRADSEVTRRMTGLGNAMNSVAKALDSLENLVLALDSPPQGVTKYKLLEDYLSARRGNQDARMRVLSDERTSDAIRALGDDEHRKIVRLATRGTLDPDPVDVIYDFARGKSTKEEVLSSMLKLPGDARLPQLRNDPMFRQAIQNPDLAKPATAEGLSIVPYEYMLRLWGEDPHNTNDPEGNKAKVVNPDPADVEPLKPEDYQAIEKLIKTALDKIAPRLDRSSWLPDSWTRDQPIIDALTAYENSAAETAMKSRFRRGHLNPGGELVKAANKDGRIGDIRERLHRCLGEQGRQVCERVLNIRVDSAAVGQVGGWFQLPGAAAVTMKDGEKKVPLEQALREIKVADKTVSQYVHDTAISIRDKMKEWFRWSDVSTTEVQGIYDGYMGQMNPKLAEIAEATGMQQGKSLHPVQFLVNSYREIPNGGSLSERITEKFKDKAPTLLAHMKLDAASVRERSVPEGVATPEADAQERFGATAEALWGALSRSYFGALSEKFSMDPLTKAGEKLEAARKAETGLPAAQQPQAQAPAQTAAPAGTAAGPAAPARVDGHDEQKTFNQFYRAKYGIDPERQVIEFARSVLSYAKQRHDELKEELDKIAAKDPKKKSDKEIAREAELREAVKSFELTAATVAAPLKITAEQIGAAVTKPATSGVQVNATNKDLLPEGYTPEMAHTAAKRIWDELHSGGDIINIRQQIDGKRPEEVRLINVAFRELSGDIDLTFYLKQSQEGGSLKVGGDGIRDKGSELAQKTTRVYGDAGSVEQTAEISQTGHVSTMTALRNALDGGKTEIIFRICGQATPTEKKQILSDDKTMDLLRQKLNETEFDRCYAELTGTLDLANMLWSRSSERSGWAYTWGTTDREGMEKDIKEYIQRRRDFHVSQYEKAGLQVDEVEVERRVKEDAIKAYSNPEVRGVIETECHGLFRGWHGNRSPDAGGTDLGGTLLNGGTPSKVGTIAGIPNSSWTSAKSVVSAINGMTPDQRAQVRKDPEFWLRLDELSVAEPDGRRDILSALNSTETDGNDHISVIRSGLRAWKTPNELYENLSKLSQAEIQRLKQDPVLVSDIRDFIPMHAGSDEQPKYLKMLETMLGLKTDGAAAADVGAKPKLDDKGKPMVDANGKPIFELPDIKGDLPASEVDRIEFLKVSAIARITTAAQRNWTTLLKEAVDVFKMEFRPNTVPVPVKPAADGAPQPPSLPDRAAIEKERKAGKDYSDKIRGQVWKAVEGDVNALLKDTTQRKTIQDAVTGALDPSQELLKEMVGVWDDDKGVLETIKKASNQVVVKQWASVVQPKYNDGDGGGGSLKQVVKRYTDARAKRPKESPAGQPAAKMSLEDEKEMNASRIALQRYAIEPSIVFEDTLLKHTGMGPFSGDDAPRKDKDKEYGKRDNTQWAEWRKALNDRIKVLPDGEVATELQVGPDDAELFGLISSSLRHAETNFSIAKEDYGQARSEGYKYFGDEHGRELDRAFGDYGRAIGEAEDKTKHGGDLSPDDKKKLDKLDENFGARQSEYTAARNQAADWAGLVASAVIGILLTALLPGAGTVAAMAMYGAIVGAAAAAGDTMVHEAMLGKTYAGSEQAVKNITTGAVTGMVSGVANHYTGQIIKGLMPVGKAGSALQQAEVVAGVAKAPPTGRIAAMATEGLKMGTIGAATGFTNVAMSSLDPSIWVHGWDYGWNQIAATIGAQVKGVAWDSLRSGLAAAATKGVLHNPNAAELAAIEPGQRPTPGRVLAEIRQSLPVALLQGGVDAIIKGEGIDAALASSAKSGLGGLRDLKQGVDDGAVTHHESVVKLNRLIQREVLGNAEKFTSGHEVVLYTRVVLGGSEISAGEFVAARQTIARMRAVQSGQTLSEAQLAAFEHWCRNAPTAEEFGERTKRNPLDIPEVRDAVAAPKPDAAATAGPKTGPLGQAQQHTSDAVAAAENAKAAAEGAARAEDAYLATPTTEVGKKSLAECKQAVDFANQQLAKAQKAVDALKAQLLTAPTEQRSAIEAELTKANDALTAAQRQATLAFLTMKAVEGKLGPAAGTAHPTDKKPEGEPGKQTTDKDGVQHKDPAPKPQDLSPTDFMALEALKAKKGEKAALEEWRNREEGRTAEGTEINATVVPGTAFHGHGRATGDKAAVITKANAEMIGIIALFAGDVAKCEPAGANTYKITLTAKPGAPAKQFTIRVDSCPLPLGQVARSQVNTSKEAHVVQISERAADDVVGRALAHEVGEIVAETRMASTGEAPSREDALRPGPHDASRKLSPHDMGRIAEIGYLSAQLTKAKAAGSPDVARLRTELSGLVEHLGLRQGDPGANERLAMIAGHLDTEAAKSLRELAAPVGELSTGDKEALNKLKDQAKTDQAELDKQANKDRPLHDLPKVEDGDIDTPAGKISRKQAEEMAKRAEVAREVKSQATLAKLRELVAKSGGKPPLLKQHVQLGGGAAVAALTADTLFIDGRGRWQADPSKDIAQTAGQLKNLHDAGVGKPEQFAGTDERVPVAALRFWEDSIAAQADVINGFATMKLDADGNQLLIITPLDKSGEITVQIEGIPTIATGFPRERIPGQKMPLHQAVASVRSALKELGTPEALAALGQIGNNNGATEADAGAVGQALQDPKLVGDLKTKDPAIADALATLGAARAWSEARKPGAKVFRGDEGNLDKFDPMASDTWIISGVGGTAISAAEIILDKNPNAHVTLIGNSIPPGLETNTQWQAVQKKHGDAGDKRFKVETGIDVGALQTGVGPDGKPTYTLGSTTAGGYIAALGRDGLIPPPIADLVYAAYAKNKDSVKGELIEPNGIYLGYKIKITTESGKVVEYDVTGAGSRFLPPELFTPDQITKVRNMGKNDAPPESGNFDGGYVASAAQAANYRKEVRAAEEAKTTVDSGGHTPGTPPSDGPSSVDSSTATYKPGRKLGSGGEKEVFEVEGRSDIVIGIVKDPAGMSRLQAEARMLAEMARLGLPVVEVIAITEHEGHPAIIMKRYAQGSKTVVKTIKGKVKIVGDSPRLNDRSIADLEMIKKVLVETPMWINDLQFLIGEDGSIVVADALDFETPREPSRSNIGTINKLIEVARSHKK